MITEKKLFLKQFARDCWCNVTPFSSYKCAKLLRLDWEIDLLRYGITK